MADYETTVTSPRPIEEVFDFVADFNHLVEWDPSMQESTQLDGGDPLRVGARYRVVVKSGGKETEMEYETVEIERPHRVKLKGTTSSMVSIDVITFAPTASGGTEVTYSAEIELEGVRKIADPLLQIGFNRMGDKARDGLEEKLSRPVA